MLRTFESIFAGIYDDYDCNIMVGTLNFIEAFYLNVIPIYRHRTYLALDTAAIQHTRILLWLEQAAKCTLFRRHHRGDDFGTKVTRVSFTCIN